MMMNVSVEMIAVLMNNKIDLNEYDDVNLIVGCDGYITPRATFLIVRNNYLEHNLNHREWAKIYIQEMDYDDEFYMSDYSNADEFLEHDLKFIRFANIDLYINAIEENDPWVIYKEYDNKGYNEKQIAFLKEVCQANLIANRIEEEPKKK